MKNKWTIREERDGVTWWMIRGGAFSNVINKEYPHRLFDDIDDVKMYCNNINRDSGRKCEVVEVEHRYSNEY
tara:strand:- start:836 stop:1051 length:216 start_codon:yes stop_codon:yes gene_type:complete